MAKKTSKKTSKKVKKTAKVAAPKVKIPAIVGKVRNIALKLDDVSGLPANLENQRAKLVLSIGRFAGHIETSYVRAANIAVKAKAKVKRDAERATAKAKRDAAKAKRDAVRATTKTKRDAIKAERTNARNERKTEQIKALRAKIAKLEG